MRPGPGPREAAALLPGARRRERVVQQLASKQLGLVTREQLLAIGFSSGALGRWVAAGRLQRLHRGVYVLGHRALAPWARELAAVFAVGGGDSAAGHAVVSHRSAAALWGMLAKVPRQVDVTVGGRKVRHRREIRVHRSARITAEDIARRHRVPVTTPEWTLVDLAGVVGSSEVERALEGARLRGAISEGELREAVARAGRTPGAAAVRALLDTEDEPAMTRSAMERRTIALIRTAGLPPPRVNTEVAGYEVDLSWPRPRLVVELDSYAFHSSRAAFERDRVKQTRLLAAGYTMLRLTWRRLTHEPYAAIADLAGALARAEQSGPS